MSLIGATNCQIIIADNPYQNKSTVNCKFQMNPSRNLDTFHFGAIINGNWCDQEMWNRLDNSNCKYNLKKKSKKNCC